MTYVYEVPGIDWFNAFISSYSKGRFYAFYLKKGFDYVAKY